MPKPAESTLFLGPTDSALLDWLRHSEPRVVQTEAEIDREFVAENGVAFLVSYGYRHILQAPVLEMLPDRAVNLHISLLPWNRGADPNLWSFVEDTPKGVTIHYLDGGIDSGDIIAQREIAFPDIDNETLTTTYQRLNSEIQALFRETWASIKTAACDRKPQPAGGSYHSIGDRVEVEPLLKLGWNTPVRALRPIPD